MTASLHGEHKRPYRPSVLTAQYAGPSQHMGKSYQPDGWAAA